MGLRAGDARVAPRGADPSPALSPWLIFARRGAALAACAALAIAGFAIGDSFAAASSAGDTSLVAATDGLDFGLLTDVVIDPSDDESLFSLARVEGSAAKAKEATP